MRRSFALLAALILLVGSAPAMSAGPALKYEVHTTSVWCDFLEGGAGTVFLGVFADDNGSAGGYLDAWSGEPFAGPPDLTTDPVGSVVATADADSLDATIPLVDADGNAAGSAVIAATIELVGEPWYFEPWRDGNRQVRWQGQGQGIAVTGALTIGAAVYDLSSGCYGDRTDATVLETNPNAFVTRYENRSVQCALTDGAGHDAYVNIWPEGDWFYADFSIHQGDDALVAGYGDGVLVDGSGSADMFLYDPDTGEDIAGSATITFSLTRNGGFFSYSTRNATGRDTTSGELLDVEGSLAVDGGFTFDLGSCTAIDATTKYIQTYPKGPKPGGKVPVNDLPSGAIALTVGSRTTMATKGASPEFEEPFECLSFIDEDGAIFEVPVGSTVWYKVAGTGGSVTVDTAGSDYDTVAAVYTADGAGGWDPLADACVDDVGLEPVGRSLQSAVSFPTAVGTWYYVQIGGYPFESFTYGTLKVAVR